MELQSWIQKISPLDEAAMAEARERQAQLAKPPQKVLPRVQTAPTA